MRFPEYKGVWEKKTVGDLGVFTGGGTPDTTIAKYWNGDVPWISSSDIQDDTVQEYLTSRFITDEAIKKSATKIVPQNSILIVSRVGIGKFAVSKSPVCTSQDFTSLTPLVDNPYFLAYYFKEKTNLFLRFSQGTSIKGFTGNDIRNMVFQVPSLPEQQKIASFFTAIDQKISQLKHKKTLLEHYKKGVMQKIFSQEIRFKDDNGQEYPKWEKKKLRDVATKKSSNISANKIEKNIGDYIIYGAAGILRNINFYEEENDYISIVKDGAGVGRLMYCKGKSSVLGTMEIIKPLSKINTYYLYCLLSNIDFAKYVIGSTIPHIYFKDYSHEICSIPDLSEQTKIANFLSAIDDKINNTQKQIEKAEVWKKGLMQQMFV